MTRNLSATRFIFTLSFLFISSAIVSADMMDQLYGPLLAPGQMIYRGDAAYYTMRERGTHGSVAFGGFTANPQTYTLKNGFTLPLIAGSEVSVDLENELPARYDRATRSNTDKVTAYQRYHLDNGQTLDLSGRIRRGENEFVMALRLKREEADWNYAAGEAATPTIFNDYYSSYQELGFVWRGVSVASGNAELTGLARLDRPLLGAGDINFEGRVDVVNGRLTRSRVYYDPADDQWQHYIFRTEPHAFPQLLVRYGLTSKAEIEAGAGMKTPFKYKFYYELYNQSGSSQRIRGTYAYDRWIECPLKVRVRPGDRWEWAGAADAMYVNQKLDSWQKPTAGAAIVYPRRKLDYYKITPGVSVKYLGGPLAKETEETTDLFGRTLLQKGQTLTEFQVKRNVVLLKGSAANGAQNFADPYHIYQYPMEFFMAGTEYATFWSGNNGTTPAQIDPQNYYEASLGVNYGVSDALNTGLRIGYRSPSKVDQYSLQDVADRHFKFAPFYYVDWTGDWKVKKNVLLIAGVHVVPEYRTSMSSTLSTTPEAFRERTCYVTVSTGVRVVF